MAAFTAVAVMLSVGSHVTATRREKKATRLQEKANRLQRQAADVQANRERRRQAREAIRRRAAIENVSAQTGLLSSSSAQTGVSNITAQESSNMAFIDQQQVLGQQMSSINQQIADAQSKAATASAIGGVVDKFAPTAYKDAGSFIKKTIFRN